MRRRYRHKIVCSLYGLLICLPACAPCREVRIESRPPGAAIYVQPPDFHLSSLSRGEGEWEKLGYAPLEADSCRLTPQLKATWDGRDLFLFDYHGSESIRFDFEQGVASD